MPKQNIAVWEPLQYKLFVQPRYTFFITSYFSILLRDPHLITQWDILPIFASFSNFWKRNCVLIMHTDSKHCIFVNFRKTKKVYIYILQKPWYFLTQNEAKMVKIFYYKVMQKQQLQKKKILQFFFSTTEAANPTNRKKSFSFLRIKNKSVSLYCKDFHVQLAKMWKKSECGT